MVTLFDIHQNESNPPLLVTLAIDPNSLEWFDAMRRAHFPSERNHLKAHITLFHWLPAAGRNAVEQYLSQLCESQKPFSIEVTGLWHLGQGVAYTLSSPALHPLFGAMQQQWRAMLKPQDLQRVFKPHITIQNKVSSEKSRALYTHLCTQPYPQELTATGIDLWHYRGGPWEFLQHFAFR